jgi:hypothetical protein
MLLYIALHDKGVTLLAIGQCIKEPLIHRKLKGFITKERLKSMEVYLKPQKRSYARFEMEWMELAANFATQVQNVD